MAERWKRKSGYSGEVNILLLATYDLGHQPFGLASPQAWLKREGHAVQCRDLAVQKLDDRDVRAAEVVAVFLPMHTATRLALPVIERVRRVNPQARIVAYGLYAALNARLLRERGVEDVIGGEFESALARYVGQVFNLRPIFNRPCPRRVENPPQVENLPHMDKLTFLT